MDVARQPHMCKLTMYSKQYNSCKQPTVLHFRWQHVCLTFIRSGQHRLARHSEREKKTRHTEEEVGRQHQGMDRSGFAKSQRAVENRGKWRILVAKSSVVPQRPSRLRDRWDERGSMAAEQRNTKSLWLTSTLARTNLHSLCKYIMHFSETLHVNVENVMLKLSEQHKAKSLSLLLVCGISSTTGASR